MIPDPEPQEQSLQRVEPPVPEQEMPPVRFGFLAGVGITMFSMLGALLLAIVMGVRGDSAAFRLILGVSQLGLMLLPTLYLARSQPLPTREIFRLKTAPPLAYVAILFGVISLSPVLQC